MEPPLFRFLSLISDSRDGHCFISRERAFFLAPAHAAHAGTRDSANIEKGGKRGILSSPLSLSLSYQLSLSYHSIFFPYHFIILFLPSLSFSLDFSIPLPLSNFNNS